MTAPDRDPLTTAREVIRQHGHLDRDALSRREKERLDLARAVIDVQAVVDQFAYAATLDRGLSEWEGMCDHFVKKFHAALNGETHA